MRGILYAFFLCVFCVGSHAKILLGANDFIFTVASKSLKVWYYNPQENLNKEMPILFVMHGNKRDAQKYRDDWKQYAQENNFLLIVPEFSKNDFRGTQYNFGGMTQNNTLKEKDKWNFSIIEKIFLKIKSENSLDTQKYYLYGHSAGAQFVHRFVQFFPESSLKLAIAANSGWYTFLDKSIDFPYGIKNIDIRDDDLSNIFSKKFIILLGDEDTDMFHKSLRNTPQTLKQGDHRFERGNNYFNYAKALATEHNLDFNWELYFVEGVGHDNQGMAKEAYKFIK